MLCWPVDEASIDDIPNALRNSDALAPEERWWLYTMTMPTTGQAITNELGLRKALRAAIAATLGLRLGGPADRARAPLRISR
jgi:hypothetical protein